MGRRPRERSETGIYHVILKGLDGRSLFYDGEDRDVFMDQDKGTFRLSERWRDASNEMISLEVTSENPKKTRTRGRFACLNFGKMLQMR